MSEESISSLEKRNMRLNKAKAKAEKSEGQYINQFDGKGVRLVLLSGEVLIGQLYTDRNNPYDYLLIDAFFKNGKYLAGNVLVRKGAVAYMSEHIVDVKSGV